MNTLRKGDAIRAPEINGPAPKWSGKTVTELDAEDIALIKTYCDEEGWRVGYRDAVSDQAIGDARNPFHPEFIEGKPYRLWRLAYRRGFFAAPIRPGYCPVFA